MIETLETQQRQLHEKMAEPDFYKRGAEVAAAANKLKELSRQLEEAYARWQELEKVIANVKLESLRNIALIRATAVAPTW